MPEPARPQPGMPPRGNGEHPEPPWAGPFSGKDPRGEPGPGRAPPGTQEPGSESGPVIAACLPPFSQVPLVTQNKP